MSKTNCPDKSRIFACENFFFKVLTQLRFDVHYIIFLYQLDCGILKIVSPKK